MRKRLCLGVPFVVLVTLLSYADNKRDKATKSSPGNTWKLKNITWSKHSGPHNGPGVWGNDGICVFLKKKPPGSTDKVKGVYTTPFVEVITKASLAVACHQLPWFQGGLTDAKGKYKMYGGNLLVASGQSKAAHTLVYSTMTGCMGVSSEDKLLLDWGGSQAPQPFSSDFDEGGVIMEDENGDGVFDANGDPVWATPPTLTLRVTSSVSHLGGGVVQYTNTLENFTGDSHTFNFPDLTSPEHPTGWSGTVPAYDTVSMSVTDTAADDVYHQNILGQTWRDDANAFENTTTFRAYVPTSRLTTTVEANLSGAAYDPLANVNLVTFTVTEPAEGAVLYRVHEGEVELVDEITEPLAVGLTYELEDATYEAGDNEYSVMTGTGVNGHRSAALTVANQ